VPEVEIGDLRFNTAVLRHGGPDEDRPAVVMLHGLIIDNLSSWWMTLAGPVAKEVADVHLYDMRGHGRSSTPDEGYTVTDNVGDLVALLDHWGLDRVHLVGNSYGCLLALHLAHHQPERVASMFLVEAHFATEGWGDHMAASLAFAAFGLDRDVVQEWLDEHGGRRVTRLARKSEHMFLRTSLIADLESEAITPLAWLEEVRCPTVAVYGSESDVLDRGRTLEAHVPGCELRIVPGRTHSLLTEETSLLREWLIAWLRTHG
jgi:pimeloyl-ACP methyl ester carboxylesterase